MTLELHDRNRNRNRNRILAPGEQKAVQGENAGSGAVIHGLVRSSHIAGPVFEV